MSSRIRMDEFGIEGPRDVFRAVVEGLTFIALLLAFSGLVLVTWAAMR